MHHSWFEYALAGVFLLVATFYLIATVAGMFAIVAGVVLEAWQTVFGGRTQKR